MRMRPTDVALGRRGERGQGAVVGTTWSSVDGAVVAVGDVVVVVGASRCACSNCSWRSFCARAV